VKGLRASESDHTLTIGILTLLICYLRHLGVDVDEMLHSIDIDPAILQAPDSRIRLDTYIKIEEAAVRYSNDPYFGLHMGEFYESGNWSILGYLMMNCRTLGEAMTKAARYSKIIGTVIHTKAYIRNHNIVIAFSTDKYAPVLSSHCYEGALSSTVSMIRNLCKKNIDPIEVGIPSPPPPTLDEYHRVFHCPVLLNKKYYYLIYPFSILSLPVVCPNEGLLRYFEDYVRSYLDALDSDKPVTMEVTRHILSILDHKSVSVGSISKQMAMSKRTLQNRLKEEGTSFRDILENTRIKLAKKYLKEAHTIEDISFMLGFKDTSVFRRTFKNWTGYTPGEFRQASGQTKLPLA